MLDNFIIQYVVSTEVKDYIFSFNVSSVNDIKVYVNNEEITQYSIQLATNSNSGVVTLVCPQDYSGQLLTIMHYRFTERKTIFNDYNKFTAKMLNTEFDSIVSIIKSHSDYQKDINLSKHLDDYQYDISLPKSKNGALIYWDNNNLANSNISIGMIEGLINSGGSTGGGGGVISDANVIISMPNNALFSVDSLHDFIGYIIDSENILFDDETTTSSVSSTLKSNKIIMGTMQADIILNSSLLQECLDKVLSIEEFLESMNYSTSNAGDITTVPSSQDIYSFEVHDDSWISLTINTTESEYFEVKYYTQEGPEDLIINSTVTCDAGPYMNGIIVASKQLYNNNKIAIEGDIIYGIFSYNEDIMYNYFINEVAGHRFKVYFNVLEGRAYQVNQQSNIVEYIDYVPIASYSDQINNTREVYTYSTSKEIIYQKQVSSGEVVRIFNSLGHGYLNTHILIKEAVTLSDMQYNYNYIYLSRSDITITNLYIELTAPTSGFLELYITALDK